MSEIDIKDLTKEPVESPFFARYLEGQLSDEEQKSVVGGQKRPLQPIAVTLAYPSDQDIVTTMRYPSDNEECGYSLPLE